MTGECWSNTWLMPWKAIKAGKWEKCASQHEED